MTEQTIVRVIAWSLRFGPLLVLGGLLGAGRVPLGVAVVCGLGLSLHGIGVHLDVLNRRASTCPNCGRFRLDKPKGSA